MDSTGDRIEEFWQRVAVGRFKFCQRPILKQFSRQRMDIRQLLQRVRIGREATFGLF
jgi:hypothetical protein